MIVRAPGTTANVGPGFDCAAIALDLWNELEVEPGEGVEIEGEGADELPHDATNLGVQAYALLAPIEGKRFRFVNRIPLERGLGSSAATIALGLAAAGAERGPEALLGLGVPLEGHADNLAAALVGGACLTLDGRIVKLASDAPLAPIAIVPSARTSTTASRAGLPATVPHADAVFTNARSMLLAAGLVRGDAELFGAALADRLHEPYRASALLEAVRADPPPGAGGSTLSGSGPTVVVWTREREACAASLRERFPAERILSLAVSPVGAL